jgi:hypothetical protein
MESVSSSEPPPHPPNRIAHLIGGLVAFITLTLPLVAIAHFSAARSIPSPGESYPFPQSLNRDSDLLRLAAISPRGHRP